MLSTARRLETLHGGSKLYILPNFDENRGRNTTFSSFLLKYSGRNYKLFSRDLKKGVEMAEHM